jgi:carboxymethylenebutenolidase
MNVTIPTGSTEDEAIDGYFSVPQPEVTGAGPWPGVIVVHDALGIRDDLREVVDRFATAGYLALAPNLYSRGGIRCVQRVFRQLLAGQGAAFDDLDAARRLLAERADCTGKIGVVGFCMGGGFALLAANRNFDASAPYYGHLPKDDSVFDDACPIVASFGRKDLTLRKAADKLSTVLAEKGVPHDVKEYPDAGHSFANRLPLGSFAALGRVVGFGYHHESSEDAWRRVLAFFSEHLR